MKKITLLITLCLLAAGAARAAGDAAWDKNRPEFKYFQEQDLYSEDSWQELAPEARNEALEKAEEPALERHDAELADYAAINRKWGLQEADQQVRRLNAEKIKAVYLWVGNKEGHELNHKVYVVKAMLAKASTEGINDADAQALTPYMLPGAIKDMRSMKAAAEMAQKQQAGVKAQGPGSQSTAKLDKFAAGTHGKMNAGKLSNLYTGSKATGDADVMLAGGAPKAGAKLPGSTAPNTTTAKTVKYTAPAALDEAGRTKSTAWTSDAYGYTITANGETKTYRDAAKAKEAIRQLPNGSVSKIILYGHGSPGMQTVGPESYDAADTAALMKGKMAKDGVIQFAGCNTASIGGATLNPAVGLSMITRRLLYFSLPYFGDRSSGTPAAEAKEQWEKGWNADLARDTSAGMKGAIVCGYRTFGLVPGRLPGLTKLMGSQEATTPGYVAGKKACYQDGKEVPVP